MIDFNKNTAPNKRSRYTTLTELYISKGRDKTGIEGCQQLAVICKDSWMYKAGKYFYWKVIIYSKVVYI